MPLLDHFHPPLFPRHPWESFHATWAGSIATALNQTLLPPGYFAEEQVHAGPRIEIDVATLQRNPSDDRTGETPVVVVPAAFPDAFEVRVFDDQARLVAAIELVSPSNKDRAGHRRAFVHKCAGYLAQCVALVLVDVVTSRAANLHAELMTALGGPTGLPDDVPLYAATYRPIVRGDQGQIEVWPHGLAVGQGMPTLPLPLDAEICVPLDLEATYTTARGRKRLGA